MATILIVDDLRANREFLVTILRVQGHRLLEAANGLEALATVAAEHPDLVITDVLMPVMDGYEFVRQLRRDPTAGRTPVLFYTAPYGAREARARALSCGVPGVLTKPAEPDEVLRIVGRVLSGEPEARMSPDAAPLMPAADREHLRLLTDELTEKAEDLRTSNARLRALINIGLELACERDSDRLLQHVCVAVRDLFAATSVTLGILDPDDGTTQRVVTAGADRAGDLHRERRGDPENPRPSRRRAVHRAGQSSRPRFNSRAGLPASAGRVRVSGRSSGVSFAGLRMDLSRGPRGLDVHGERRTPGDGAVGAGGPHLREQPFCGRRRAAGRRARTRDPRAQAGGPGPAAGARPGAAISEHRRSHAHRARRGAGW